MDSKRTVRLAYLSLVVSVLFYSFFMASKHLPIFRDVAPFLEDPYDAVGSFAVIGAVLIAIFNFIRLASIRKHKLVGADVYVIRGNLVIGWSIVLTLLADSIAIINMPPHHPMLTGEVILFSAMTILLLLALFLLIINYAGKKESVPRQDAQAENEIDFLFSNRFLSLISPRTYPFRFSILFSISLSVLIAVAEIVVEGPAPTLQQTAVVFAVLTAIGTIGFFIILMVIGRYLGILGKIRWRA